MFDYTGHNKLADLQNGVMKFYQATDKDGVNHAFEFGVYSLLWFNPDVKGGSIENLPKTHYFDDLGLAFARDGWQEKNVAMMFKCAPYGGYKLNDYRREKNLAGVNVAHDDPDVNQFQIFADGAMLRGMTATAATSSPAATTRFWSTARDTRGEGGVWTQPIRNFDMARLGVMTTWKDAGNIVVAEGEGAGAYPGLNRYRRTAIWVKGGYVLILDDIRAAKESEITWLVQADQLDPQAVGGGPYKLKSGAVSCPFTLTADSPLTEKIAISTADNHGRSMQLQQLQASAKAQNLRIAAVFDPWNLGNVKVEAQDSGRGSCHGHGHGPEHFRFLDVDGRARDDLHASDVQAGAQGRQHARCGSDGSGTHSDGSATADAGRRCRSRGPGA